MIRSLAIALAVAALASAASAQPMSLSSSQMDRVTAGALALDVTTLAATHAPSSVTLPAPLTSALSISQAADVTITIDAAQHPALTTISTPSH